MGNLHEEVLVMDPMAVGMDSNDSDDDDNGMETAAARKTAGFSRRRSCAAEAATAKRLTATLPPNFAFTEIISSPPQHQSTTANAVHTPASMEPNDQHHLEATTSTTTTMEVEKKDDLKRKRDDAAEDSASPIVDDIDRDNARKSLPPQHWDSDGSHGTNGSRDHLPGDIGGPPDQDDGVFDSDDGSEGESEDMEDDVDGTDEACLACSRTGFPCFVPTPDARYCTRCDAAGLVCSFSLAPALTQILPVISHLVPPAALPILLPLYKNKVVNGTSGRKRRRIDGAEGPADGDEANEPEEGITTDEDDLLMDVTTTTAEVFLAFPGVSETLAIFPFVHLETLRARGVPAHLAIAIKAVALALFPATPAVDPSPPTTPPPTPPAYLKSASRLHRRAANIVTPLLLVADKDSHPDEMLTVLQTVLHLILFSLITSQLEPRSPEVRWLAMAIGCARQMRMHEEIPTDPSADPPSPTAGEQTEGVEAASAIPFYGASGKLLARRAGDLARETRRRVWWFLLFLDAVVATRLDAFGVIAEEESDLLRMLCPDPVWHAHRPSPASPPPGIGGEPLLFRNVMAALHDAWPRGVSPAVRPTPPPAPPATVAVDAAPLPRALEPCWSRRTAAIMLLRRAGTLSKRHWVAPPSSAAFAPDGVSGGGAVAPFLSSDRQGPLEPTSLEASLDGLARAVAVWTACASGFDAGGEWGGGDEGWGDRLRLHSAMMLALSPRWAVDRLFEAVAAVAAERPHPAAAADDAYPAEVPGSPTTRAVLGTWARSAHGERCREELDGAAADWAAAAGGGEAEAARLGLLQWDLVYVGRLQTVLDAYPLNQAAPPMTQATPPPDEGAFTLFKLTHLRADVVAAVLKVLRDHLGPGFAARPDGAGDTGSGSGEFELSIAVPKGPGKHGAAMEMMDLLMQCGVGGNGSGENSCGDASAAGLNKVIDSSAAAEVGPAIVERTEDAAGTMIASTQEQDYEEVDVSVTKVLAWLAIAALTLAAALLLMPKILRRSLVLLTPELSYLHIAAARNDAKAVKELLVGGADPDAVNDGDATAVKIFLSKRDPSDLYTSRSDCFALAHVAAMRGDEDVLHVLIDFGGALVANITLHGRIDVVGEEKKEGYTPLHMAAAYNHAHIVNALVKRGAFPETRTSDPDLEGFKPLHIAAKFGSEESLKSLISHEAPLDAKTQFGLETALHIAATKGHDGVCRILIDADRNRTIITAKDAGGRTPLYAAVEAKNEAICQILVNADSSPIGMKDQIGYTPLHVAADHAHEAICKMLLEADSSVINAKDNNGNTPLHTLIQSTRPGRKVDVAKLLVSMGADLKAKNKRGLTALDMARKHGLNEIALFLESQ
ncbi:hypothetical protein HDU96_002995 [Phlyctochytrium bullatum]|nr:hypothetical protein HDU96_002995 [Phlyctochytrium bullatum]